MADVRISALPQQQTPLTGLELVPIVQNGLTVQTTLALIGALSAGGVTTFSGGATGLLPSSPTVGAITLAGILNATYGGTGIAAYAAGDLLRANSTTTLQRLAIGTNGQVLTVVAGAPAWAAVSTGTVTSVGGTGTVNGLTLTGTVTSSGNLTLGGVLDLSSPPAIGGTAAAAGTFTTLRVDSTISLAGSTGTAGYVLTSQGASAPTWTAVSSGSGNVVGPASATANGIALFDGTTGLLLKNSSSVDALIRGMKLGVGNGAGNFASTALGVSVLQNNTSGSYNIGVGYEALFSNTTGEFNSALGFYALRSQTTSTENTAFGYYGLYSASTGSYNTALGGNAGYGVTTGSRNLFLGVDSGNNLTTGSNNVYIGKVTAFSPSESNNLVFGDGTGERFRITATGAWYINADTGTNGQAFLSRGASLPPAWQSLGTMSTQDANNVAITGGSIDGTTIGSTTAAAGKFTAITNSGLASGRVVYTTTGGLEAASANLTFNGTTLTAANDISVAGMTIGLGGGSLAQNAAFGGVTLPFNTTGNFNVAVGYQSMFWNKTGSSNVGLGFASLFLNTTANNNLAMGVSALTVLTTNVATLGAITAGSGYTNGTYTAVAMTPVSGATFVTYPTVTVVVAGGAVSSVTLVTAGQGASSAAATVLTVAAALIGGTGSGFSISVGSFATGSNNTAIGYSAGSTLSTGSNNTIVGYQAAASTTTVSNEITLGNGSVTAFRIPGLSITAAASALTIGSQFAVTNTTSAVNYLNLTGAATGAAPTISAQGSDANIGLVLNSKGTGVVALGGSTTTNGGFAVAPVASGVNYIIATGAQTGGTPKLTSSTANIPVSIQGSNTWANFANVSAAIGVSADITNVVGAHLVFGSLNGNAPYVGASNYSTSSNSGLTLQTNGVRQFLAAHTASAVNYVQATGAVTTAAPELSAQGSDANIDLLLRSKGTGAVALGGSTVANSGFRVNPVASSVNYVQAQGGITGSPATVSSQGTDSNVTLWLQAQGNARTFFVNGGAFQASINPNGAAVNYLLLAGGSTGNGAELSVAGSDANINLKLTTKGTGVLQFGTYTAGVVAQAGYITITDAGGTSRRLLVG